MAKISYRPEIDGLRAVSVIGVVLYHAGLGFSGGYVGVDVFFVISGFLITSIIMKDLEAGTFSLVEFWARRIRRILPAVSVMVMGVLMVGAVLLSAELLVNVANSSIAQTVMLSNVRFCRATGYFSIHAELKPLLHTWSLAVEEQFYLIFPFALAVVYRFARGHVLLILSLAMAISFGWSVYGIEHQKAATFFLLPARAWELLAGALIALTQDRFQISSRSAQALSIAGLASIIAGMVFYDLHTPFPGPYAILPVAGAVAFIVGCKGRATLAGKLLSMKPLVFVGLISYSLYLWHWPVFAYSKHVFIASDLSLKLALVFLSVVLSVLSWRFVERPFRGKELLPTNFAAFRFGMVVTGILMMSSVAIWKIGGWPERFDPEMRLVQEDTSWSSSQIEKEKTRSRFGLLNPGEFNEIPDFVFWGDSHGIAISKTVDLIAKEYELLGEVILGHAEIPITGLSLANASAEAKEMVLNRTEKKLQSILDRQIPNVILVSRWSVYCEGLNEVEVSHGESPYVNLVTDKIALSGAKQTPEMSRASFQRQLQMMIDRLTKSGTKVWLIKQIPEANVSLSAFHFQLLTRFPSLNEFDRYTTGLSEHRQRQQGVENVIDNIESPLLTIIDPAPAFFDNDLNRLEVYSERSHYRDDDHLTHYGSERFVGPLIENVFMQISDVKLKSLASSEHASEPER